MSTTKISSFHERGSQQVISGGASHATANRNLNRRPTMQVRHVEVKIDGRPATTMALSEAESWQKKLGADRVKIL